MDPSAYRVPAAPFANDPTGQPPKGRRRPTPARRSEPTADSGDTPADRSSTPFDGDDQDAFSSLYEAYYGQVYRYLLSRTSNPSDSEELTSRTFLNAFANLDQYEGRGKGFLSWLMSIAHNLLANWYRDRGRRPPTASLDAAVDVAADLPAPESSLERNELTQQVRAAVQQLAADRQQLISLKYVDGLSNAEIGRIMERTEGAIKSLHHRTLQQLHGALADVE
ncbi:MAG TPA: sigma-70 family RNA polymerase sigma factor [Dehalococcoidia bacterium]|nr:sigma-70 family RNA polymerase sigma factor [Dehalococcoidia bacterium]